MTRPAPSLAALLALLLLLAACGGGGTPPSTDDGGMMMDDDPGPTTAEQARAALDTCLVTAFDAALEHVAIYLTIVADESVADGIMIVPGTEMASPQFRAQWSRDPSMSMMPVQFGDMFTEDPAGDPAEPFTDMQLDPLRMNGISELAALLGMLDGVVYVLTSTDNGRNVAVEGEASALYTGGTAGALSGTYQVSFDECALVVAFDDIPRTDLGGTHPTGTFDLQVTAGTDVLAGTVTADGSSTASGTFTFNGTAAGDFTIDLVSGAVAIAP